ncbi:MAG: SDR family oxidoreductase [Dehalococcoidia bacterium]|nr:SDR family oxidoreductase [Dehalococcoidia bacterium]
MAGQKHLDGKIAIVTGGAGGMGSWISRVFAEQGAKVVVADTGADVEGRMGVDPTRPNAVVEEIRQAGGEATTFIGDIAEVDVAEDLVRTTLDTYGGLDILVSAHGILRERMIFNMTEDEWDGVVRAHLKGCWAPTKFASIYWRTERERGGRIIYFTSLAGIRGGAGQPNYSAAQAGKVGLMLAVAKELGRYGVTANCISPQASTRMTDRGRGVMEGESERGIKTSASAAGSQDDPRNVTPAIVYLASDEGKEITGRVVGATGNRITMWREPQWTKSLYYEEPLWDIDTLFKLMPETLAANGFPLPHPELP